MQKIKTVSDLKYYHEYYNPCSVFFSRENMHFQGDTMRNYGVRKTVILTNWNSETEVEKEVYELYRKNPVKGGNQASAFFDIENFGRVFEKK